MNVDGKFGKNLSMTRSTMSGRLLLGVFVACGLFCKSDIATACIRFVGVGLFCASDLAVFFCLLGVVALGVPLRFAIALVSVFVHTPERSL